MRMAILLTFIGLGLLNFTTNAQIIHVPSDYPTIQQGIDAATDGDTVLVDTGIYTENLYFNSKKITVASHFLTSYDTSYISKTIIDGNQMGSVVTFNQGEDSTSVLAGFTITNGFSNHGGGVHCSEASPVLRDIVVKHNEAGYEGGGIYLFESEAHIVNSRITSNVVETAGGGIICFYSNPVLENVYIADNYAHILSGGIHLEYSSPVLINSQITGNSSDRSGGLGSYTLSYPLLLNVTISNNSATLYRGGGMDLSNSEVVLTNVIMWGNTPEEICFEMASSHNSISISYSDISGGLDSILTNGTGSVFWLEGNIDDDPLFSLGETNPYSLSDGSPCIDSGTLDTTGLDLPIWDIMYNFRIWDGDGDGYARVDMGAYEYGSIPVGIKVPVQNSKFIVHCYPNPLSSFAMIEYELNVPEDVAIIIFNNLGQLVDMLVNAKQLQGKHQVIWNATGRPPGIYFYRLTANDQISTGKLILIR
jgi:hypothetical protein